MKAVKLPLRAIGQMYGCLTTDLAAIPPKSGRLVKDT